MDKNIENQTLETVSNIVQKKFAKSEYLSGKLSVVLSNKADSNRSFIYSGNSTNRSHSEW